MTLTRQGVRDLNHLPARRTRSKQPDPEIAALVLSGGPVCRHNWETQRHATEPDWYEAGAVRYVDVCQLCGDRRRAS